MRILKQISILFLALLLHLFANGQEFKAGAAVRVITPNPLIAVSGGVGKPNPVTEKMGDLTVRALVLEKGKVRVAIVNIDNLGWPAVLGDKSRKLITGISPENILIGVTHTHSAPDAYAFPDENGNIGADLKYLEWCVTQIADAVNEAVKNLEPADLKISVDEAKGKIAYNYYAPALYDPRCGVIQTITKKGKAIATLVNYATHPEIIGKAVIQVNPDIYCTSKVVEFPVESEMMRLILNNSPLTKGTSKDNVVTTRVNLLNLGTAQILTIPGEALPNIGFYLKRNMPTKHPFLFGLTNDAFGYMLTKVDYNSFERYNYISRVCLGEMTGEIYMEEALKLINSNPAPGAN